ncbi:HNH endonuclease [Achromobacter xylosoxidans]
MTITHEELKKHIHYDPETGAFTRLIKSSASAKLGQTYGNPRGNGYRALSVGGKEHYLHRLAWFYVHGSWPKFVIDHINGDKTDNRLCNLRDIPQGLNLQNIRKPKGKGPNALLGVAKFRDRFRADIRIDGKKTHLGVFASAEAAHEAYIAAKRKFHPASLL